MCSVITLSYCIDFCCFMAITLSLLHLVDSCVDIVIFQFSTWQPSAILDYQNFTFIL